MPARKRWRGSTSDRGYGAAHMRLRKRLLAAFVPGQACTRCGWPMWDKTLIDLAHTPDRSAYEGLQHRACNRSEGAIRGNRRRGVAKEWAPHSRW